MKHMVFGAIVVTLIASLAHGVQQYTWQAVNGEYSGNWDVSAHWTPTPTKSYPGVWDENESTLGDFALFDFRGSGQVGITPEIVFPEGMVTNLASIIYRSTKSNVTTFIGTNTVLVMPKPTKGGTWAGPTTSDVGLSFLVGGSTSARLFSYDGWTAPATLRNFKIRFNNDAADERKVTFESGDFDLSAGETMWFFRQSVSDAEKDAVVEIGTSAAITADVTTVGLSCPSRSNILKIRGKAYFARNVKLPVPLQNVSINSPVERLAAIDVFGGELNFGTYDSNYYSMLFGLTKAPYGSTTSCVFRVSADAGVIRQTESRYPIISVGPGRHQLKLANGSVGSFAGPISLGCVALSTGEVSVVDSTASFASRLSLGGATAADIQAGATGSFEAENALVTFGDSLVVYDGRVALGDKARIVLTGASSIAGDDTLGGTRTFAADGATIEVGANAVPVSGFGSAVLGAKGLEIVAAGDVTIAQPFSSAEGEDGKIVLSTPGQVTFAKPADVTVVVTNGGSVAFGGQADAAHPLRGLVLGADGKTAALVLAKNETVWIQGGVALAGNIAVRLSGIGALGDSHRICCTSVTVSQESRDAWEQLVVTEGLPAGLTWNVSVETTANGTDLILTVVEDVPVEIEVTSGTDSHATNITFAVGKTLQVKVDKDASAVFAGDVKYGRFEKTGAGAVDLSGVNVFKTGLLLDGGLLSIAGPDALGITDDSAAGLKLADGTLEVRNAGGLSGSAEIAASQGTNGMVIVKNDADITMPVPSATQGSFTKRGKGRLTLEVAEDSDWKSLCGNEMGKLNGESVIWDNVNGAAPTTANRYGAVNVAEGELVFRGRCAVPPTVSVKATAGTDIGLAGQPCAADFAQPGLVLDHVFYYSYLAVGSSASDFAMGMKLAPGTSAICAPYLVVTNGATLQCQSFLPSWRSTDAVPAYILLDNGTLDIRHQFNAVECLCTDVNGGASVTNVYTAKNGSSIYSRYKSGNLNVNGRNLVMDFDGSTLARNEDGATIDLNIAQRAGVSATLTFRNGSYCGIGGIWSGGPTQPQTTAIKYAPLCLAFDDSEWFVGAGDRDVPSSNMNVTVSTTGRGLKLNPPAGSTWRLYTHISGTGGIVKGGEGTLFVDNWYRYFEYQDDTVTLASTGTNVVTGGVLAIKPTAVAENAKFFFEGDGGELRLMGDAAAYTNACVSGTGTLGAGTWTNLRVLPKYGEELTVDGSAGAVLDGSVTFDFEGDSDEVLRFKNAPVVIARWTGTAPSISKWRTRNTGVGGSLVFAVGNDGTVLAQWKKRGFILVCH